MSAKKAQSNNACVLPMKGRYTLWVQSPNGTWMLLSGKWISLLGASRYAIKAGYYVTNDREKVLAEIESQLELRAGGNPMVRIN